MGSSRLSLAITGGEGAVTVTPERTACTTFGGECAWDFPTCTEVQLRATPYTGSTRATWSGCDSASGFTCGLLLERSRTVSLKLEP